MTPSRQRSLTPSIRACLVHIVLLFRYKPLLGVLHQSGAYQHSGTKNFVIIMKLYFYLTNPLLESDGYSNTCTLLLPYWNVLPEINHLGSSLMKDVSITPVLPYKRHRCTKYDRNRETKLRKRKLLLSVSRKIQMRRKAIQSPLPNHRFSQSTPRY